MKEHEFSLCDLCLKQYRALTYDPTCDPKPNAIPFGTVFWPDEHPFINGRFGPLANHRSEETLQGPCYMTGANLTAARYGVWTTSLVEPRFKEFWTSAQRLLPEWPGFKRIELSELPDAQKLMLPKRLKKIAGLTAHCPNCHAELRTHLARQCFECGADWHATPDADAR
jgi:hypothetical protein